MNEKLYFLRGSTQDSCGFLYDGKIIVEGVICPVNVDLLAINVKEVLSSPRKSGLVDSETPLKIKVSSSSLKESDRIIITIKTVSGKKFTATVGGLLLVRHQGIETILVNIGNIRTKIIHK